METALVAALGLSLPFAAFPLVVWKRFGIDLSHVAGVSLLLVALLGFARKRRPLPPAALVWLSVAMMLVPLVPYFTHRLPGFSTEGFWRTYLHLGFLLAVFLALASSFLSWRELKGILVVLVWEALAVAIYGVWQTVAFARGWPTGIPFLNSVSRYPFRGDYGPLWRATSLFEEPKWLSLYLLPCMCYAYALVLEAIRRRRYRRAGAFTLALGVLAAAEIPTLSPGGMLATACLLSAMGIHFAMGPGRRYRARLLLAFALVVVIAGTAAISWLGPVSRLIQTRIGAEFGGNPSSWLAPGPYASGFVYVVNFRYALELLRQSPGFGVGPGQFRKLGKEFGVARGFPTSVTQDGPWIGFGGILAEFGIAGAVLSALLIFAILRASWKRNRGDGPWGVLPALLILAVLLKEAYSGFYLRFWTWFPLGLAALCAFSPPRRLSEHAEEDPGERRAAAAD